MFDRYKAALYRLYNRELRRDPTLRGQIVRRLTIEPDGSARFTDTVTGIMREELGFDCPRLHLEEAEERGEELIRRFREYAGRHGVDLP